MRVELLQLHAGDEMRPRLQAEGLRFGQRRRRQRQPRRGCGASRWGEGHNGGFRGRVVEQGSERRGGGEVLHRVGVGREQQ